jgi:hypothetical protein
VSTPLLLAFFVNLYRTDLFPPMCARAAPPRPGARTAAL